MDMTTGDVAEHLSTSIPRVRRAADRLGLGRRTTSRRLIFSPADLAALRAELGDVPASLDGRDRVQLQILAALARAPRGLRSVRALARAAGVSPTAAAHALARLRAVGLAAVDEVLVAEGSVRTRAIIRVNPRHPAWPGLAQRLAGVTLPRSSPESHQTVPRRLAHVFWNADIGKLDLERDGAYLATRVLTTGDLDALAWAAGALPAQAWSRAATARGLRPDVRAVARALSDFEAAAA